MTFIYTYRSSDGQRHTAEIEAESRDAAFETIRREMGVKPIKVMAAGGRTDANGRDARARGGRTVAFALSAVFVLLLVTGGVWWWIRTGDRSEQYTVMTPQGPVTYTLAEPLPRQAIPGDRTRIEAFVRDAQSTSGVFKHAAEAYLARFAEPGRRVGGTASPAHEDFVACLKTTIRIASTDFTEVVDLKRIVTGMKREMRAYLAGGGAVDGYLAELEKRQRLEISYRERAEQRLNDMLKGESAFAQKSSSSRASTDKSSDKSRAENGEAENPKLRAAYAYWLKANASLKSMGIYELPLPDALRAYQMGMGIDE